MMLCRQGIADEPCEDEECDELAELRETPAPAIPTVKSNRLSVPLFWYYLGHNKLGPWRNRFALAVAASTAFVVFAAVATWSIGSSMSAADGEAPPPGGSSCSFGGPDGCRAQDLFMNEEVHEVAVRNILNVGRHHFSFDDRLMIRRKVQEGFRGIAAELRIRAPALADRLAKIRLNRAEKDAVLATLQLLSDSKVQELGFEVGQAVRESVSTDREHLARIIVARLLPRLGEITRLRESAVPASLSRLWGSDHQWNMTLDPENVGMMQAYDGGLGSMMFQSLNDVYAAGGMDFEASEALKSFGAVGGVVEEGRALVDIIKLCARLYSVDTSLPLSATSLAGTLDFGSNVLSCQLGSNGAEIGKPKEEDFMKAIFCPLKFGAQGLDALRAVPDMTGRQPARGLFADPTLVEVATENILLGRHGLLRPGDRELVRSTVEQGFRDLSAQLEERAPNAFDELEVTPLTKTEREAIFYSMSFLSDPRVQSLGFHAAGAVRRGSPTGSPPFPRKSLEDSMQSSAGTIQALRKELLSSWMRRRWDTAGHEWDWSLDFDAVRDAQGANATDAFQSLEELSLRDYEVDAPVSREDKVYIILSGVVEQGRALLRMIQLVAHLFDSDLEVTPWAVALEGAADPERLSCARRSPLAEGRTKIAQACACPLRLGVQGIDVLRSYRTA